MGLYLCIFDGDDEDIDGVDVGSYSDFNALRDYVTETLENGQQGSIYPTFIIHSDCDGEWSVHDCTKLSNELKRIGDSMKLLPAVPFHSDWQLQTAKSISLVATSAFESFIDVDGEFLVERLHQLSLHAVKLGFPITFQ